MSKALQTNTAVLDRIDKTSQELILEILSFSGGENQISEDHVTQTNEGRVVENWAPISIGGMEREAGFTEVGDIVVTGSSPVASQASLMGHFHFNESDSTSAILGVIDNDLVILSGSDVGIAKGGLAGITADLECMAVNGGDKSWITNTTDNLLNFDTTTGLATPSDQPASAHPGIYKSKRRLIAEGNSRTVEYSRRGTGNWTAADAWTLANDAATIDLPDYTYGTVPEFIDGNEAIFTKKGCYHVFGVPNLAYRYIPGSWGCSNRFSIAQGAGGVFFFSEHPTKAIVFWDRTKFTSITEGVDWIDNVSTSNRMWAVFREHRYHFIYNDSTSGVSYPQSWRIYDTRFGSWMNRPVNSDLGDNIGIPFLLDKQNNELYAWSSRDAVIYQLESGTDDAGQETQATYKTKNFTSRNFSYASGAGGFGADEVTLKILKIFVQYFGTAGEAQVTWLADFDNTSDSLTFDMTASGAKLGSFVLGTDTLTSNVPDRASAQSVSNKAVGRRFSFQITHSGTGTKGKIKKIKIWAIPVDEI